MVLYYKEYITEQIFLEIHGERNYIRINSYRLRGKNHGKIKIQLTTVPKEKPDINGIAFGTHFSDHMFLMDYVEARADKPQNSAIRPHLFGAFHGFHYAQEIFEGMKAYRTPEGRIQLSGPWKISAG